MDKMFDDYVNRKMFIEEIRPLTDEEKNNLVIKDSVSEVTYEINCDRTLDDIRNVSNLDDMSAKDFMSKLREIENEPLHILIEAEAKKTEFIIDSIPSDSTFTYKDTYNFNEYSFDGYEMNFDGDCGNVKLETSGYVDCNISDGSEAYEIEELFDEAIQFNEILSERGIMPSGMSELEEKKSDKLLELEFEGKDFKDYGNEYDDY